jgi:predicted P-loop ATPase
LNKAEINALKSIFSKDYIKVRHPFDRKPIVSSRRANFLGSTNKIGFLNDETGSVRWLCFEIIGIDWNYSTDVDINLVWSQAYTLFKEGFKYELNAEEIQENEKANKEFINETAEMQLINEYFEPATKESHESCLPATKILKLFQFKNNNINKMSIESIGKAMKFLEFERGNYYVKERGNQSKGYYVNYINPTDKMLLNE